MTVRRDLRALTDESLATLANRGLVKRAHREVDVGSGPTVAEDDDGTVTADFGDGTRVVIAPGTTLEDASCSCPGRGVCRHLVMTVVAHRGLGPTDAGAEMARTWSPGSVADEEVEAHVGARALRLAAAGRRAGYRARVRRAVAPDPVVTVELPSCTVRFLVPGDLGYARVDAAAGSRLDAVALAVWAARRADEVDPDGAVVDVEVGGEASAGSGTPGLVALLGEVLADGVVHLGPEMAPSLARERRALDRDGLRWPVDLLDDLGAQLDAHRDRGAQHDPAVVAALVAEGVARHRCVVGGGRALRVDVLGTEEAAETRLRLVRLVGLGARVGGDEATRTVEVYLAHPDAGVVLAVRRTVAVAPDEEAPDGAALGARRAGGARLAALAGGSVVTESAVRAANRLVRLSTSQQVGRTTVAPSAGEWGVLPASLVVTDVDALAAEVAGWAPALVRPRLVAQALRVVDVVAVTDVAWAPGAQRLTAMLVAPTGRAVVELDHRAAAPGAVDALAAALHGAHGPVRFVAGHVRRRAGRVVVRPTAVVAGSTVVVPDLAEATGTAVPIGRGSEGDPLVVAVARAEAVVADMAHQGWRHLSPGWADRARRAAADLRRVGLGAAGVAVDALAATSSTAGADVWLDRWADAHIRLLVTAEQL